MNFHFSIEYKTQWGEELRVALLGQEYALSTTDGVVWTADVVLHNLEEHDCLEYRYALYRRGSLVWREWDIVPHRLFLQSIVRNKTWVADDATYVLRDAWRPIPEALPLFSSAYTDCVAPHGQPLSQPLERFQQTLQLRVVEPRLSVHQRIGICGNTAQLGNWQCAVPLQLIGLQEWAVNINVSELSRSLQYKYVILNDHGDITEWEDGQNRTIDDLNMPRGQMWVVTDTSPRFNLRYWKGAGVVIPVFSLRSQHSYGVGDFGDLKQFVQWAAHVGMHAVQILPINDTTSTGTWQDSYPYNAISVYAFHPIYCNLSALPPLSNRLQMEDFLIQQQQLNALPQMDYESVFRVKIEYLHATFQQEWKHLSQTKDYKEWFAHNQYWLVPYAAFSVLRDTNRTANFHEWPRYSKYSSEEITRFVSPRGKHHSKLSFYYYVQYHLHIQLSEVRTLARTLGVILKGDIPIGISPHSVEAWAEPQYFNLNSQAGAPPDDFSTNGQNWGFPTYNWPSILRDGATWWIHRLQFMAHYFDAYRIDHVLGFFRIWDIPAHSVHGLLGQFSPSLPLSPSEIESYGFQFDVDTMTQPFISDDVLYARFGHRAELVKTLYLDPIPTAPYHLSSFNSFGGTVTYYRLKSQYDTQRKVQQVFQYKTDAYNLELRDGLYSLISDVLFLPDRQNPQLYHPRIAAQSDYAYRALSDDQRKAFDALYDDYYYHRHSQFWYREAMQKLPLLTQATPMLCCAEDLGMVPESVPWVMQQLRLLSLQIQTMPKEFGHEFADPARYSWRSVATISTHDMAPLRQWWEEDPQRTQRFLNQALHIDGQAPAKLPAWLAQEVVNRHLYSPSILCLLSLQDWLSIDEQLRNPDAQGERINFPANPRHYWRWRMHLTIEQLLQADHFNTHLATLIHQAGRD